MVQILLIRVSLGSLETGLSVLNNRPLYRVEDDGKLPVFTPSAMMFGQPKLIPDEDLDEVDPDMRKRARYLRRCSVESLVWRVF